MVLTDILGGLQWEDNCKIFRANCAHVLCSLLTKYIFVFSAFPQVLAAPPSGMSGPVPSAPALSALGDGVGRTVSPSPAMIAMSMFNTSRSAKSLKDLYAITREFNMNKCLPRWPAECQVFFHHFFNKFMNEICPKTSAKMIFGHDQEHDRGIDSLNFALYFA